MELFRIVNDAGGRVEYMVATDIRAVINQIDESRGNPPVSVERIPELVTVLQPARPVVVTPKRRR